jgi:hypothetical protein
MSIMTGILRRYVDISKVSGTGDVAEFAEFSDGAVAVRWHGDHPSTACWNDIRDVEFVHGHKGATEIVPIEADRLLKAYQRVVPFLLSGTTAQTCAPHPDHPDRLRLTFLYRRDWAFFVALLDGSTHAATHEEVNGETEHRWLSEDGNLWLIWYTPTATPTSSKYADNSPYDDRD